MPQIGQSGTVRPIAGWKGWAAFVVVAAFAGCGDDVDTSSAGDAGGTTEAVTVRLEPIGLLVDDAFTGDLDLDPPGAELAIALPDVPPLGVGVANSLARQLAAGDDVGLYGGTRDVAACDVEQLLAFLTNPANEEKARAWADVLDIEVGGLEEYVDGLTAVRLRHDTRVTNHGFSDGDATAIQAVLQAGTAVLVDDRGVPRVKCACGNPLLEPAVTSGEVPANPDDAWSSFDAADVVAVEDADVALDDLTLLDLESGELFSRPAGSTGDADTDVADLVDKCALVPESPSCAAEVDTVAEFCSILGLTLGAPSIEASASSDASSAQVTITNADEILTFFRSIADDVDRLPLVAPAELQADAQAFSDAVRNGLASGDANQLYPSLEVLTNLGTFFQANCQ